jgi:hypothetical protein
MKLFLVIAVVLSTVGCSVIKVPALSGTDQENGLVQLSFDHSVFQKPEVNWEQALLTATQQCQSWGYKKPQQAGEIQSECISKNDRGNCNGYKKSRVYSCEMSNEQKAFIAEKKRQEELAEQRKKAEFAKEHPYLLLINCGINGQSGNNPAACFYPDTYKSATALEIHNGSEYIHLLGYELNRERIPQFINGNGDIAIPLKEHFSVLAEHSGCMEYLKLRARVVDTLTGDVLFEKSAAPRGYIAIKK